MILKILKLGIKTILNFLCERITIKDIDISIKNNSFRGRIDKLNINAENIILDKLFINNINIIIYDLFIKIGSPNKLISFNNFNADMILEFNRDNLKDIIFHDKWSKIRSELELFICDNNQIKDIDIREGLIYFSYANNNINYQLGCSLKLDKINNNIMLKNNIKDNIMLISMDQNILLKYLLVNENKITAELSSEIRLQSK